MPWKPPAVGSKTRPYDERWRRIRAQTLQAEPLCRLCLAGGKTVSATVVDHIVPLADGGTHAQSNLQPLCKRCHDAIKTPADVAARDRAKETGLSVVAVAFEVDFAGAGVMDQRCLRRLFATAMGWANAHAVSLAAMDGIVSAARGGSLPRMQAVIVTDDARWARTVAGVLQIEPRIQPMNVEPPSGKVGTEAAWLRERYGTERDARTEQTVGGQIAAVLREPAKADRLRE